MKTIAIIALLIIYACTRVIESLRGIFSEVDKSDSDSGRDLIS